MSEARVAPAAHARVARVVGQLEVLVVGEEQEAHEKRREHGLGPAEFLEQESAVGRLRHQEVVEPAVLPEQGLVLRLAPRRVAVFQQGVAAVAEITLHAHEHVLDRTPVRIALRNRSAGHRVVEVLQDDETFLQHPVRVDLERGQRRRAGRLLQQPIGPRLRDVDHLEAHRVGQALQREQDLEPLAEGAGVDLVDGGLGHRRCRHHAKGGRLGVAHRRSTPAAQRSTIGSSKGRPAICRPIGMPSSSKPQGTEIAGRPVRLNG